MNRTKKFALNSFAAAINQIVIMIVGFITPRVMISTYGSEVNGLVSSLSQFISYISLVEAGIGGAAIYSLYKPLAEKNHTQINRIVSAARKSYLQAGYIFSSGVFVLAVIYSILCKTNALDIYQIFLLTIILGTNGCLDFFLVSGFRVLLTADQRNYVISLAGIMQTVCRTAIICALAFFKTDVVVLYAIALIPLIGKVLLILFYGKRKYSFLDVKVVPDNNSLRKRWDVVYQQILGTVQTGAPTVIATLVTNLITVSVYSVYNMVMLGINGILSIFITGLPAGFGELIAKKEIEQLKKSTSEFEVAYYYMLSIVYGITFIMLLPFISIYTSGFTDANYISITLAIVIVLNGLLYNIKTPQSMLIISAGMYAEMRWRVTVQVLIIIILGTLLGFRYGIVGILLGSCLSNLYRTIDLLLFVPKNITRRNPIESILRIIRVFVSIAIIILPSFWLPIVAETYKVWILYAIAYGIYAVLVCTVLTLIFDKKSFVALIKRLKIVVERKSA